jgi:hypothetical protein
LCGSEQYGVFGRRRRNACRFVHPHDYRNVRHAEPRRNGNAGCEVNCGIAHANRVRSSNFLNT